MQGADIVIVGAGVIGSAIAYELARTTTARIVVIEREAPGKQASNAAAGVLAVASGQARKGALLELRRRSSLMFPAWVAALEEETGVEVGYRTHGLLSLAFSEAELEELTSLARHRQTQGMRGVAMDRQEIRRLEPAVAPSACGGVLFPDDCSIDAPRFVDALVAGARRRGVSFQLGIDVRSVQPGSESVRITTAEGRLEANVLIVAAGAWSAELLGTDVRVPMRPVQGEMLAVRSQTAVTHTLAAGETYLVPRRDELLVGSTMRLVGFDRRVRAGGIAELLNGALRVAPALSTARVLRWWSGLRPCPTIRRPIISRLPMHERVILATGHHRNGILLAPMTAALVRAILTSSAPDVPLKPFGYRHR